MISLKRRCPDCDSKKIVRTKKRGLTNRYYCQDCSLKFKGFKFLGIRFGWK